MSADAVHEHAHGAEGTHDASRDAPGPGPDLDVASGTRAVALVAMAGAAPPTPPSPGPGTGAPSASRPLAPRLLPIGAGNAVVARLVQRTNPPGGATPPAAGATPPAGASPAGPVPSANPTGPTPEEVKFFESPIENLLGAIGTKKVVKTSVAFPVKNWKVAKDYIVIDNLSVAAEAGLEIIRSGSTTVLSVQSGATRNEKKEDRKSELESQGKLVGGEIKTSQDGLITTISEALKLGKVKGSGSEIKWLGLEGILDKDSEATSASLGAEATEKLEIPLDQDGPTFTPSVSLSIGLASVDLKKHTVDVGTGAVNLAGELAYKKSLPQMEIAGLRLPKYDKSYAVKVTGSINAKLNKEKIVLATLEKAAMMGASRLLPQVAKGMDVLNSPPVKMIVAGVVTVANGIDAYIEGERQRHLGELAATLPYVFAGGFLGSYKKAPVAGAPATAFGPVAQFQAAGAAAGNQAREAVITELKAKPEAKDAKPEEIASAVDVAIKEKPMGLAEVATTARKPVDDYVLKKFVDERANAATSVFDFLAGTDHKIDPEHPENSKEYVDFRDRILKAYTTRTNDPYFQDTALKNAMAEAQKQGVAPDQVESWIANYMMNKAQGEIDEAEPDTRMDKLEEDKAAVNDLLSGYVSDEDIRKVQPLVLNHPIGQGREELLAICRNWKQHLNERQAKLLGDLTGA